MASFLTTLHGLSIACSGLTGAPAAALPVGAGEAARAHRQVLTQLNAVQFHASTIY